MTMTDRSGSLLSGSRIFSLLFFLLPALALTTSFGVGLIEVAILVGALFFAKALWLRRRAWFSPARFIAGAFVFNLAVATASLAWSGFHGNFLDNPTRQLLVVAAIGLVVFAKPNVDVFWYGLFVGTVGALVLALYQRFGMGMARAEGFHMAIMFGDLAMVMGLMSLASLLRFAHTRIAWMPYITFLAGMAASLLSVSRGGWIALAFSFVPLYLYGTQAVRRRIMAVACVSIALFVAACFIPQLRVGQRIAQVASDLQKYRQGEVYTEVGTRLEMWKGAWKIFGEHPITGVGRANFHAGLNDLIRRGEVNASISDFYHAHNEVLNALATEGILGALALMFVYAAPLVFFMRYLRAGNACRPYALAGVLLVLSYIACGLTQVMFSHHIGTAFYAVAVCMLAGACLLPQCGEDRRHAHA